MKGAGNAAGNLEAEWTTEPMFGAVSDFHAGGIGRPLVVFKTDRQPLIPHQNWRGQFLLGTYASGALSDCASDQTSGCEPRTTAWHRESKDPDIRAWYGGLVDGMRDASGQMYMRNRYYDPAAGQFTQGGRVVVICKIALPVRSSSLERG